MRHFNKSAELWTDLLKLGRLANQQLRNVLVERQQVIWKSIVRTEAAAADGQTGGLADRQTGGPTDRQEHMSGAGRLPLAMADWLVLL